MVIMMTNIDLKKLIFDKKMKEIEDDVVPFGAIDDGSEFMDQIEDKEKPWHVEYHEM